MKAALVRDIETKQLLGFYVGSSIQSIAYFVDELTDPTDFEYLEIDSGGFYWNKGQDFSYKAIISDKEIEITEPISYPLMSELMYIKVIKSKKWKQLPSAFS